MSANGIKAFDSTLQATHIRLDELMRDLHWEEERQQAYQALRAALHALRDRLPVENAAHLAAQLPMLVRGFYYECWVPSRTPMREHTADEFLNHVSEAFQLDGHEVALDITQAVFGVLRRHISQEEVKKVKKVLPKGIRDLWPQLRRGFVLVATRTRFHTRSSSLKRGAWTLGTSPEWVCHD